MNDKEVTITITLTEREIVLIGEALKIILKKIESQVQCDLTDPNRRGELP